MRVALVGCQDPVATRSGFCTDLQGRFKFILGRSAADRCTTIALANILGRTNSISPPDEGVVNFDTQDFTTKDNRSNARIDYSQPLAAICHRNDRFGGR
jgi:hypothetical protein